MSYRFSQGDRLDRAGAAAELERFLKLVLRTTGLRLRFQIRQMDPPPGAVEPVEVLATLWGPDQGLLLERGGQLLAALEHLAVRWLRLDPRLCDHLRLDAASYRTLRVEELRLAAQAAAERVRQTGQPFRFQPMPARERRIVHLAAQKVAGVRTVSEGEGEQRQVVIYPGGSAP